MFNRRVKFIFALTIIAFLILVSRLFVLQVVKGDTLARQASGSRLNCQTIFSNRGDFLDRNEINFTSRNTESSAVIKSAQLKENIQGIKIIIIFKGILTLVIFLFFTALMKNKKENY